jgi:hypothetical protein
MDYVKYTYSGPDSALALTAAEADAAPHEVLLRHGAVVELPADNAAVKTLVAMGHLSPAKAGAAAGASISTATSASSSASSSGATAAAAGGSKTNPKA